MRNVMFGTTHSSGKMHSVLSHSSSAVYISGYGVAEVIDIQRNVNNIHDTHCVTLKLTHPLDPKGDDVAFEKHLVTTRFLGSFDDIRYQE